MHKCKDCKKCFIHVCEASIHEHTEIIFGSPAEPKLELTEKPKEAQPINIKVSLESAAEVNELIKVFESFKHSKIVFGGANDGTH